MTFTGRLKAYCNILGYFSFEKWGSNFFKKKKKEELYPVVQG